MPTLINVVAGDHGYELDFTLQKSDASAYDLTGSTLVIKIQQQGTAGIGGGAMSIISAGAGTCKYIVQATDFPVGGNYYGEIDVTNSGNVVSFSGITIVAAARIPIAP